jgi:hypothetical protein
MISVGWGVPHIDEVDLNAFKSLIHLNCCQGRLRVIGDIQIAHHTIIFNPIALIPLDTVDLGV